ncbi:DNA (cytosine-5)-methyltransferase 1-like [Sipha flava]|jgi:DNA (cytosine-5)-methyltransferase 1|uniref:Cytosine-specific methyltransferase n=1 Tax=Sipha flava TaxID=143950 RepID=A0A2S2QWQ1_9HEMI|nr:DNA (cytosine-5)-methyltransferase 1-like [Sipha flava]
MGIDSNKESDVCCEFCQQTKTENVVIPPDAEIECVALTNEVLTNIDTDDSNIVQHTITNYSIYDENFHLCSIDSGMMERDIPLYLTGLIKPIHDFSSGTENGIAVKLLGPILEWWLTTYDGGSEQTLIGISTEYAEYLLIEPHCDYKKYIKSVTEKINLSSKVISYMLNSDYDDPTYEDILSYVVNSLNPATGNKFSEEDLITYAQFVIDQVEDYDSNNKYILPLTDTQFIETLSQLSGAAKSVKPPSRRSRRARNQTSGVRTNISKREFTKATTTELVKDIFENMFAAQLEIDDKENHEVEKDLIKTMFDNDNCVDSKSAKQTCSGINDIDGNQVRWKNHKLSEKMFVVVKKHVLAEPMIGCIEYFFKTNLKDRAHLSLFIHGYETILGETSDPQEIFAIKKCLNIDINDIVKILDVTQKIPSANWFNLGGSKLQDLLEPVNRNSKNSFFYQFYYDEEFGRLEYPKPENQINKNKNIKNCQNCQIKELEKKSKIPEPLEFIEKSNGISYFYKFKLHNVEYKIGSFIYLPPNIFSTSQRANLLEVKPFDHKKSNTISSNEIQINVDESKYPEYYRKKLEYSMRGSNENTPNPFEIAEIIAVYVVEGDESNVKLLVQRMYRAEQIPLENNKNNIDMNMLYWSEEQFRVQCNQVFGKCYVSFISNILDTTAWYLGGPDRFYFAKKYDFATGSLIPEHQLPSTAKLIGKEVGPNMKHAFVMEDKLQYIPEYKKIKPLRGLDIFAGCGGLSKGLEDSGLVVTKWAIESDDKAAAAFKLNNPDSTVFNDDCNLLLKLAMSGKKKNDKNQMIPQKGEVDFICGGPPCQGFSGMNRFSSGQYSFFKNCLVVTFLSFLDFYRPKFFILENVRNFASFKRSMVLKLTLRCITRMGYQCTFGILQAGNFGVPQTRRRLIIIAAAPGEELPLYPEPIHVFSKRSSSLNIQVDDKKFKTNCKYEESAPMRTVTVHDAWSDLPKILNGAYYEKISYKNKPITHLQKLFRYPNNCFPESILIDHICKDMSPLVQARIELIPVNLGSDWRDLPNIKVQLSDGTMTNKLVYNHNDLKNGKGKHNALRGVCSCASGNECNPQDRQNNTIIPWCLPHTANRHNNWAGLYGRIAWTGFCSTTITNPEPMGKQGRVLHPDQNRVVSVRECARSQGFKDSFKFYGPIVNKHRQIGNAVPPPMGKAIGLEIVKVLHNKSEYLENDIKENK